MDTNGDALGPAARCGQGVTHRRALDPGGIGGHRCCVSERRLGRERAWVVHGTTETGQGLDDISTSGVTLLADLLNGNVVSGVIDSRWLNIPAGSLDELKGGDAGENATHIEGILSGEIQGAKRNMVVVNAAGGFVVAGIAHDMSEGISLAREQINSGRALERLKSVQAFRFGA